MTTRVKFDLYSLLETYLCSTPTGWPSDSWGKTSKIGMDGHAGSGQARLWRLQPDHREYERTVEPTALIAPATL